MAFRSTSRTKTRRLSRSKIDLFVECRRCFFLEQVLGVKRPSMAPFTLNIAVDHLLKKEFDLHRDGGTAHPLMKTYGIDAIPFAHDHMEKWRHNFTGVEYFHEPTGLTIFGAVDDVWVNPEGELIVVDYKATAKDGEITLSGRFGEQYKRQMAVYQWLLRNNGFAVSNTGYFVYVNGKKDAAAFDGKLEFDVILLTHEGDPSWIEPTLMEIKKCLESTDIPTEGRECEHCRYRTEAGNAFKTHVLKHRKNHHSRE